MNAALRDAVQRMMLGLLEGATPPGSVMDVIEAGSDRLETCTAMLDHAETVAVVVVVFAGTGQRFPGRRDLHERFGLTERESQVAEFLARRKTNKEIARALSVTAHTARRHTERVLLKLGVSSRRDVRAVLGEMGGSPDPHP